MDLPNQCCAMKSMLASRLLKETEREVKSAELGSAIRNTCSSRQEKTLESNMPSSQDKEVEELA